MRGSTARDGDGERVPVIGIVGLGATGLRVGHALQAVKTRYALLGHDVDAARVRAALGAGAVDRGTWSLAEVAAAADLLFLCEPVDDVCATVEKVAPHVRPGTLVTDTATLKAPILDAAARWVPEGVAFIGGHPIMRRPDGGEPRDGLRGVTYCLCAPPRTDETALRVMQALVDSVGAIPYFIDPVEHDALITGTHLLPAVLGAAVVRVLDRSPSAVDLRRLIGADLQGMLDTAAGGDAAADLAAALAASPSAGQWLGRIIDDLDQLRLALDAARQAGAPASMPPGDPGRPAARTGGADAGEDRAAVAAWLAAADRARPGWRAAPVDPRDAPVAVVEGTEPVNPLTQLLFGRRKRP